MMTAVTGIVAALVVGKAALLYGLARAFRSVSDKAHSVLTISTMQTIAGNWLAPRIGSFHVVMATACFEQLFNPIQALRGMRERGEIQQAWTDYEREIATPNARLQAQPGRSLVLNPAAPASAPARPRQ